jgi:hypothetical protein
MSILADPLAARAQAGRRPGIQRRDAVAGAFTVAWQLTGAVHCNKFQ